MLELTSPTVTIQVEATKWEVRRNDERRQLLGTFYDETSRDLFIEAVENLCRMSGGITMEGNIAAETSDRDDQLAA